MLIIICFLGYSAKDILNFIGSDFTIAAGDGGFQPVDLTRQNLQQRLLVEPSSSTCHDSTEPRTMRSISPTPAVRAPIIPLDSGISPSFVPGGDDLEPGELNQSTISQRGGPTDTGDVSPRELDTPARIQVTSASEESTSDATKQMELNDKQTKPRGTKRRRNKTEDGDQVPRARE